MAWLILTSANNYYEGLPNRKAERILCQHEKSQRQHTHFVWIEQQTGERKRKIVEKPTKLAECIPEALSRVAGWLEKAAAVAENDKQRDIINTLISFNQTGDLKLSTNVVSNGFGTWLLRLILSTVYRNLCRSTGIESQLGIHCQLQEHRSNQTHRNHQQQCSVVWGQFARR